MPVTTLKFTVTPATGIPLASVIFTESGTVLPGGPDCPSPKEIVNRAGLAATILRMRSFPRSAM